MISSRLSIDDNYSEPCDITSYLWHSEPYPQYYDQRRELNHSDIRLFIEAPQDKEIDLLEMIVALQINPQLLLG